jgi:hypothetical protein
VRRTLPIIVSHLTRYSYFVQEDSDEIRSIKNPDNYFKYFLSRNPRYNERQRFAMNGKLAPSILFRLKQKNSISP